MAVLALFPLRRADPARPPRPASGTMLTVDRASSLSHPADLTGPTHLAGPSSLNGPTSFDSPAALDSTVSAQLVSPEANPILEHRSGFYHRYAFDHGRPTDHPSLSIEQHVMSEGDDPQPGTPQEAGPTLQREQTRPQTQAQQQSQPQQQSQGQQGSQAQHRSQDQRLRDLVIHQGDFVARSLRNLGVWGGELDDCVQKVFLVAARRLPEIEFGKERAFLFSCAQNTAAHFRRSLARKREVSEELLLDRTDPDLSPDQLTERKRYREVLDRLLETMDENIRATFILYSFEEMTMAEIAEVMGVPPGTVASRLRRAREIFKQEMTRLNLFEQFRTDQVRTDQVRNKQEIA